MDTEDALTRELKEAQEAMENVARAARLRRQDAVMRARAAGWSKYKIAKVLGVRGPTVDSIIASAERPDPAGE